jgi:uncharacterized membrane protein
MPLDTFIVIATAYDSEADALADFEAVRKLYADNKMIDTFDAAVLTRDADGKVDIVKKHEEPVRQGAVAGGVVGLAVGALIAILPPIGLGAALLGGGAIGAGAGAVAGHVKGGLPNDDLKKLGELLESGESGLLVIAASDLEAHVERSITHAKKQAKAQLQADTDALKKQIDAL